MTRRRLLSADEARLWHRVAATATPIHRERPVPAADEPAARSAEPALTKGKAAQAVVKLPGKRKCEQPAAQRMAVAPDASGHRKVRRGAVEIDGRIDLHGMRQAEAEAALSVFVVRKRLEGARCILVVTGKGRPVDPAEDFITPQAGVIRRRLPEWLSGAQIRPHISGYAPAHPRHGGSGAFYVLLKRREGA
jgi:DNA-nicking Smr family endonuclease